MKNIRGLSLTRPWPFAFVNGPIQFQKRVENRTWSPPQALIGGYLALHAAQSWDEGDRLFIFETMNLDVPDRDASQHSQIFAVCKLTGFVTNRTADKLSADQQRWYFGPFGWLLEDFVELMKPVACKGAQGLWTFDKKQNELAELRRVYQATIDRQRNLAAAY